MVGRGAAYRAAAPTAFDGPESMAPSATTPKARAYSLFWLPSHFGVSLLTPRPWTLKMTRSG
jgi:hypothetical protein